ncbi:hypothetical protein [Bifidobacterium breve]|uniref:hypothetical protein n=1 Tax=Bifidobacterium breve TaxID=1685 RepID=UPI0030F3889E
MALQEAFEGFDEIGNFQGFMEKKTRQNLTEFFRDKQVTTIADTLAALLIAISHNIDSYLLKGKNASTLFDSFASNLDRLQVIYPERVKLDDELAMLLQEAKA